MKISARDAYDRLFKYFGLRSRDGYLNASTGSPSPAPASSNQGSVSVMGDIYHRLYGDEDNNFSIVEICQKIKEFGFDNSKKILCITPYDDDPTLLGSKDLNELPLNSAKITGYSDQGLLGNSGKQKITTKDKLFTIKGLNKKFPDNSNRIDVIQVFPSKGVSELADTDILTLYLSTINSVNMSQALPYVDVAVSVQGKEDSDISSSPFSFGNFLNVKGDTTLNSKFLDQSISNSSTSKARTVASMEIFTSPQTLVNADPVNVRYNENTDSGRHIDIFRPFLSIESLSISVAPANAGLIAFKNASMKLKLFDRGRLSDIAPLVAPSRFGVVKFDIEYGWSHPGGGTKTKLNRGSFRTDGEFSGRLADANDDRIGQLIDSMRVKESYQVVNSNFSFEQDGSVSIDLKLSMLGAPALTNTTVKFSGNDASVEEIEDLLKEIQRLLSNAPKGINIPAVISGGADTFIQISDDDMKNLKKFVDTLLGGKNKASNSARAAASSVSKLIISKGKTKSKLELFKKTKDEQVQKFISELKEADDPFIRTEGLPNEGKLGVTSKELTGKDNVSFASLGSVIMNTLGPVLQMSGDVIFVFNCFNRNAGAMFDHNIAQFPIRLTGGAGKDAAKIVNLQNVLKRELKKTTRITPEGFMSIINEYFILRESTEAYGLSDLYVDTPSFNKDNEVQDDYVRGLTVDAEKPETQLVFEQKKILNLANIYGSGRNHPTFTKPRLSLKIDVKPGKNGENIIRVIVFDQACSNIGDIQEAFNEVTSNGYFETDEFNNPLKGNARGADHGVTANEVFEKLNASDLFEPYTPDTSDPKNPQAPTLLEQLERIAANGGTIEQFETNPTERNKLENKLKKYYFLKKIGSNDSKIRDIFYQFFPVIIYGSMGSGVISAQLSSNQNPALTTIALQKQGEDPDIPSGLPMLIHPTQLSMEVFGTPLFKYSQKFFVDFGTGTSADNFYVVGGVDMNFGPGEFKTSLKMIQLDVFGRFMKTRDTILKTLVSSYAKEKEQKKQKNQKIGSKPNSTTGTEDEKTRESRDLQPGDQSPIK